MTGTERIEAIARISAVYLVLVALFFLDVMAVPYPLSFLMEAPFLLMGIYYWSVYRPSLLPAWVCFAIGLLMDILSGFPMGLRALLFVVIRMFLIDQRRFLLAQGFIIFWLGFAFIGAVYFTIIWLVLSVIAFQFLPLMTAAVPLTLGIMIFPLICAFLRLSHKIL